MIHHDYVDDLMRVTYHSRNGDTGDKKNSRIFGVDPRSTVQGKLLSVTSYFVSQLTIGSEDPLDA